MKKIYLIIGILSIILILGCVQEPEQPSIESEEIKTCNSDFDCQDVSIEFKCENNQCVKIECVSNQECWNISNSLTCENNFCVGHSCTSIKDCYDLNPLTKNFCNETIHKCSNRIVPCKSGDNYCPPNCDDWELDSDCGVPQIWNMVASNDPSNYLGETIYPNEPSNWMSYQPMINKVNELVDGLTNDYDKMVNIANWVKGSKSYNDENVSVANNLGSVIEIFEADEGVCLDAAILTTAMLRMAGIPSRSVLPVSGVLHEYTEAYVNDEWMGVEATFGNGSAIILENLSAITIAAGHIYDTQDILELEYDTVRGVTKFKSEITKKEFPAEYGYVVYPTTNQIIFYNIEDPSNYSETYKEGYRGTVSLGCGVMILDYDCVQHYCFNKSACPPISHNESCASECDVAPIYKTCKCGSGDTAQFCEKDQICCWNEDMNSWSCSGGSCIGSGPTFTTTTVPEYDPMWSVGFEFTGKSEFHEGFWKYPESKNGYLRTAFPAGRYKLSCNYVNSTIAYKEFEVKEGSEIKITPESLEKDPNASDELFDLLIQHLTKSTKGL